LVVAVNKWDLMEETNTSRDIERRFVNFLPCQMSLLGTTSVLEKQRILSAESAGWFAKPPTNYFLRMNLMKSCLQLLLVIVSNVSRGRNVGIKYVTQVKEQGPYFPALAIHPSTHS
jgi:predicted GTPase